MKTLEELAKFGMLSLRQVRNMAKRGIITAKLVGRAYIVEDELRFWQEYDNRPKCGKRKVQK